MPDQASRRRRRIWARLTLAGGLTCLLASTLIWLSHFVELALVGTIHFYWIGNVFGFHNPLSSGRLGVILPVLGVILLYTSGTIWAVGVRRGSKRALLAQQNEAQAEAADLPEEPVVEGPVLTSRIQP